MLRVSLECAKASQSTSRLTRAALALLLCFGSGLALRTAAGDDSGPLLSPVPEQAVIPGETLNLRIRPQGAGGDGALLMIDRGPLDANLVDAGDGSWFLRWRTPLEFSQRTTVRLTAVDRLDRRHRQSQDVVIIAADADGRAPSPVPKGSVLTPAPLMLPRIAPQHLVAGQAWSLWVRPTGGHAADKSISPEDAPPDDAPSEAATRLSVRGAPAGMETLAQAAGWHRISWRPPLEHTGSLEIELVATGASDPLLEARRSVTLNVAAPKRPGPQAGPSGGRRLPPPPLVPQRPIDAAPRDPDSSANRQPATSPPTPTPTPTPPPQIAEMPTQIVSAGHVVKFDVRPEVADGDEAIVQIDRLPRNASFDERADGSRAFHWLTSDRDQGEHRFRLTAISARDASLRSSTDVLVVVGDPTRSRTVPAGSGGGPGRPNAANAAVRGAARDVDADGR